MANPGKIGRNDPCHCGSGKKFKHCHEGKAENPWSSRVMIGLVLAIVIGAVAAGLSSFGSDRGSSAGPAPGQVWSPEHGHYH